MDMEFFYKLEQKLLSELERAVLYGNPEYEKNIKKRIAALNQQMEKVEA